MDIFTVSFFGHRRIYDHDKTENKLTNLLRDLLQNHQYVDFLIGRNGDFDTIVSSVIRKTKRLYRSDNSSHVLVLPYPTAEWQNNLTSFQSFYDEVEICEKSANAHFRSAIQIRNRNMIDRSDLVVFYLKEKSGGAYLSYQYAKKQNKKTINVAEL